MPQDVVLRDLALEMPAPVSTVPQAGERGQDDHAAGSTVTLMLSGAGELDVSASGLIKALTTHPLFRKTRLEDSRQVAGGGRPLYTFRLLIEVPVDQPVAVVSMAEGRTNDG